MNAPDLDEIYGSDDIIGVEQVLPRLEDDGPRRDAVQAFDRCEHDSYHVIGDGTVARTVRSKEAMMRRTTLVLALLFPAVATAQTMPSQHHAGMMHAPMDGPMAAMPTQPGQGAFAAIQEIVAILEADPTTEWSKVNIEALRQHLIDMDNVTLHADVKSEAVDGGMAFVVSGSAAIRESIQRMVVAHAATMNGVGGWKFIATTTDAGATLTVKTPASEVEKLQGLGFIGVLTHGMHHQMHHLMIARGGAPHSE